MNITLRNPDPVRARQYFDDKLAFTLGPVELEHLLKSHENINLIDVRAEEDYRKGHIPGAVNLPMEKWDTLEGLDKDKTNVLYCYTQSCHLAARAAHNFAAQGYPVMELEGGFEGWRHSDLEIEKQQNRRFAFKH